MFYNLKPTFLLTGIRPLNVQSIFSSFLFPLPEISFALISILVHNETAELGPINLRVGGYGDAVSFNSPGMIFE